MGSEPHLDALPAGQDDADDPPGPAQEQIGAAFPHSLLTEPAIATALIISGTAGLFFALAGLLVVALRRRQF